MSSRATNDIRNDTEERILRLSVIIKEFVADDRNPILNIETVVEGISSDVADRYRPKKGEVYGAYNTDTGESEFLFDLEHDIFRLLNQLDRPINRENVRDVISTYLRLWNQNILNAIQTGELLAGHLHIESPATIYNIEDVIVVDNNPAILIANGRVYELRPYGTFDLDEYLRRENIGLVHAVKAQMESMKRHIDELSRELALSRDQIHQIVRQGMRIKIYYDRNRDKVLWGIYDPELIFRVKYVRHARRIFELDDEYVKRLPILLPMLVIDKDKIWPTVIRITTDKPDYAHPNVSPDGVGCTGVEVNMNIGAFRSYLEAIKETMQTMNLDSPYHDEDGEYREWAEYSKQLVTPDAVAWEV